MSPNRRILLNIIATYGRSLYALVCGLFISRWLLAALGKTDFGLDGVVGGMMVIELLAGKMRLDRGRIAAGEDDMRQTYTVKHIRKGLTLLSYFSECESTPTDTMTTDERNKDFKRNTNDRSI